MKRTAIFLLIFVFSALIHKSYAQHPKQSGSIFKNKIELPGFTMNFNLIGVALYGPIIQAEFKLASRLYLVPMLRYSYAGIASNYEWTNFENDSKYYPSSGAIGIGLKGCIPIKSKRQLIYYGLFGEFIHEKGLHNMNSSYEYEQTRMAAAVYGNLGYRWNSRKNFYLNLGILPGIAFDLKNEGFYNTGASEGLLFPDVEKKNRIIGMIDFSFGWNLKR